MSLEFETGHLIFVQLGFYGRHARYFLSGRKVRTNVTYAYTRELSKQVFSISNI